MSREAQCKRSAGSTIRSIPPARPAPAGCWIARTVTPSSGRMPATPALCRSSSVMAALAGPATPAGVASGIPRASAPSASTSAAAGIPRRPAGSKAIRSRPRSPTWRHCGSCSASAAGWSPAVPGAASSRSPMPKPTRSAASASTSPAPGLAAPRTSRGGSRTCGRCSPSYGSNSRASSARRSAAICAAPMQAASSAQTRRRPIASRSSSMPTSRASCISIPRSPSGTRRAAPATAGSSSTTRCTTSSCAIPS